MDNNTMVHWQNNVGWIMPEKPKEKPKFAGFEANVPSKMFVVSSVHKCQLKKAINRWPFLGDYNHG